MHGSPDPWSLAGEPEAFCMGDFGSCESPIMVELRCTLFTITIILDTLYSIRHAIFPTLLHIVPLIVYMSADS